MSCIVFVCNFLFINYDKKISEEDNLVEFFALDMAIEDITKTISKKDKEGSSGNNFEG